MHVDVVVAVRVGRAGEGELRGGGGEDLGRGGRGEEELDVDVLRSSESIEGMEEEAKREGKAAEVVEGRGNGGGEGEEEGDNEGECSAAIISEEIASAGRGEGLLAR